MKFFRLKYGKQCTYANFEETAGQPPLDGDEGARTLRKLDPVTSVSFSKKPVPGFGNQIIQEIPEGTGNEEESGKQPGPSFQHFTHAQYSGGFGVKLVALNQHHRINGIG